MVESRSNPERRKDLPTHTHTQRCALNSLSLLLCRTSRASCAIALQPTRHSAFLPSQEKFTFGLMGEFHIMGRYACGARSEVPVIGSKRVKAGRLKCGQRVKRERASASRLSVAEGETATTATKGTKGYCAIEKESVEKKFVRLPRMAQLGSCSLR